MQRVEQQAFITIPNIRKNKEYEQITKQKKQSVQLKDKILEILKGFSHKQIVQQACKNISIPLNFISINFIQSRSKQQLPRIYSALCTLKKQINRIYRHAGQGYHSSYSNNNHNNILSQKNMLNNMQRRLQSSYCRRELTPKQILKLALEDQLKYRQKLQYREKKCQQSENLKKKILEKRKEIAKKLNKKAFQIYSKQKQKQQKYYDQIQCNFNQSDINKSSHLQKSKHSSSQNKRIHLRTYKSIFKNYQTNQNQFNYQQQDQLNKRPSFQTYFKQKQQKWRIKQQIFNQMRIKRKNSLNDKFMKKQQKAELIRLRRYHYNQQEQYQRLKKIIQKEKRFKNQFKQSNNNESDQVHQQKSQKNLHRQGQSVTRSSGKSFNHSYTYYGKKNNFFQQAQQKQNLIRQKQTKISQNKQLQLQKKVDRIREIRLKQQLRRQKYHNNRFKLIEESNNVRTKKNESFILQASDILKNEQDLQQNSIKQKHENILAYKAAEQTILKLRRLPKSVIEEKLNTLKEQEVPVNQFFKPIANIMKFL